MLQLANRDIKLWQIQIVPEFQKQMVYQKFKITSRAYREEAAIQDQRKDNRISANSRHTSKEVQNISRITIIFLKIQLLVSVILKLFPSSLRVNRCQPRRNSTTSRLRTKWKSKLSFNHCLTYILVYLVPNYSRKTVRWTVKCKQAIETLEI